MLGDFLKPVFFFSFPQNLMNLFHNKDQYFHISAEASVFGNKVAEV